MGRKSVLNVWYVIDLLYSYLVSWDINTGTNIIIPIKVSVIAV